LFDALRIRYAERHECSHGWAKFLSKLVAMVRIEKTVSRTIFEKRNHLISRATPMTSPSFSKTLVFEKPEAARTRYRTVAMICVFPPDHKQSRRTA
jgi:hypothetical protein